MAMSVQPPKGRLRLYAWTVWGSLYSSAMSPHGGGLIGGPKEPPVLSPVLTKASGCGRAEDGGGGKQQRGRREEQVSHRIVGWDELEGGLATGLQGDTTHSFTHSLTHSHTHTYTHSQWGILVPVAGLLLYK